MSRSSAKTLRFTGTKRLVLSKSLWWQPHSRIRRAMRIAKRKAAVARIGELADYLHTTAEAAEDAAAGLQSVVDTIRSRHRQGTE